MKPLPLVLPLFSATTSGNFTVLLTTSFLIVDPTLMKELNKLLGIKMKLSTAYHPQTDGQTERINQDLELFLCIFINHRQSDWFNWISIAEFTYDNKIHFSTKFSPF